MSNDQVSATTANLLNQMANQQGAQQPTQPNQEPQTTHQTERKTLQQLMQASVVPKGKYQLDVVNPKFGHTDKVDDNGIERPHQWFKCELKHVAGPDGKVPAKLKGVRHEIFIYDYTANTQSGMEIALFYRCIGYDANYAPLFEIKEMQDRRGLFQIDAFIDSSTKAMRNSRPRPLIGAAATTMSPDAAGLLQATVTDDVPDDEAPF